MRGPETKCAMTAPTLAPAPTPLLLTGETQPAPDSFSQVYQRRLSNGIRVNYRKTDFEPCSGLMRLAAPGGRMAENMGVGPDGFGAVVVGESRAATPTQPAGSTGAATCARPAGLSSVPAANS